MSASENEIRAGCEGGALILANDAALSSLARAMIAGVVRLAGRDPTDRAFLLAALVGRVCMFAGDWGDSVERSQLLRLVRGAAEEALEFRDAASAKRAYLATWYVRNRARIRAKRAAQLAARTPEEAEADRARRRAYFAANRETLLLKQRIRQRAVRAADIAAAERASTVLSTFDDKPADGINQIKENS